MITVDLRKQGVGQVKIPHKIHRIQKILKQCNRVKRHFPRTKCINGLNHIINSCLLYPYCKEELRNKDMLPDQTRIPSVYFLCSATQRGNSIIVSVGS
jgi:hypothetical protein